jgi:hypothetical protein
MYLRLAARLSFSYYYIIFAAVISFGLLPRCRQAGERFDKVAQECSEDKAKGILTFSVYESLVLKLNHFL